MFHTFFFTSVATHGYIPSNSNSNNNNNNNNDDNDDDDNNNNNNNNNILFFGLKFLNHGIVVKCRS
jgi:hypothetical protein